MKIDAEVDVKFEESDVTAFFESESSIGEPVTDGFFVTEWGEKEESDEPDYALNFGNALGECEIIETCMESDVAELRERCAKLQALLKQFVQCGLETIESSEPVA